MDFVQLLNSSEKWERVKKKHLTPQANYCMILKVVTAWQIIQPLAFCNGRLLFGKADVIEKWTRFLNRPCYMIFMGNY